MHPGRRTTAALALVAALALPACGGGSSARDVEGAAAPSAAPASSSPTPTPTPTGAPDITSEVNPAPAPTWTDVPESRGLAPARVRIPSIGVDADVIDLGLDHEGHLEVPEDFSKTGWFDRGARPGEYGAAIIAGHIDNDSGPAVFYRLRELQPGDEVVVEGADGERVTFAVERVKQYPKDDFPTQDVYGFTEYPSLRLITCGGLFNAERQSYESNTIAFARRVPPGQD